MKQVCEYAHDAARDGKRREKSGMSNNNNSNNGKQTASAATVTINPFHTLNIIELRENPPSKKTVYTTECQYCAHYTRSGCCAFAPLQLKHPIPYTSTAHHVHGMLGVVVATF